MVRRARRPINGKRFLLHVEKVLLSTLQPGDIVVLDNLRSRKSKALRPIFRTAGARLLFLL
jgi:transposase